MSKSAEDYFRDRFGRGFQNDAERELWDLHMRSRSFTEKQFRDKSDIATGADQFELDELGFTKSGVLPPDLYAPTVQMRAEREVARYNRGLGQQAVRGLQSGLESLAYYRPGGAAGLASGQTQALAQTLLSMRTEAPDLLADYRIAEAFRARKRARRAGLTKALGTLGGSILGGLVGGSGGAAAGASAGGELGSGLGGGEGLDIPEIPSQAGGGGSGGDAGFSYDASQGLGGGVPQAAAPAVTPQTQPEPLSAAAPTQMGAGPGQSQPQVGPPSAPQAIGAGFPDSAPPGVGQVAGQAVAPGAAGGAAGPEAAPAAVAPDPKEQIAAGFAATMPPEVATGLMASIYHAEFSGDGFYDRMQKGLVGLAASIPDAVGLDLHELDY